MFRADEPCPDLSNNIRGAITRGGAQAQTLAGPDQSRAVSRHDLRAIERQERELALFPRLKTLNATWHRSGGKFGGQRRVSNNGIASGPRSQQVLSSSKFCARPLMPGV